MYDARGIAARAMGVSIPFEGSYYDSYVRYRGRIVAVVFNEILANM